MVVEKFLDNPRVRTNACIFVETKVEASLSRCLPRFRTTKHRRQSYEFRSLIRNHAEGPMSRVPRGRDLWISFLDTRLQPKKERKKERGKKGDPFGMRDPFSWSLSLVSYPKPNRTERCFETKESITRSVQTWMLKTRRYGSTLDSVRGVRIGILHLDPWSRTRHVSSIGVGSTRCQDGRTFSMSR